MEWLKTMFQTEIVDGKSLSDLVTLEMLTQLVGNVVAGICILFVGFLLAGWVKRRIVKLGEKHETLDNTLFHFLGNIARYVVLIFALLFVLNTFGVQTTSIIAALGAAGLAIGLACRARYPMSRQV